MNNLHLRFHVAILLVAFLRLPAAVAESIPQVLQTGLNQPVGLALQPQTNHVFLWEAGLSRVVRVVDGNLEVVLLDVPHIAAPSSTPPDTPCPNLAFVNRQTLAILLSTGTPPKRELFVAEVPPVGSPAQRIDSTGRVSVDDRIGSSPQLRGIVADSSALYCALERPDGRNGLGKLALMNPARLPASAAFGNGQPLARSYESDGRITCLAVSPRGELVAGRVAQRNAQWETQITFIRATDGRPLLQLATGLPHLGGLAYGPRRSSVTTAHLYALARGSNAEGAGLYRLDAAISEGSLRTEPTRIAALDQPTAMAFSGDGSLYVTILGQANGDKDAPAGQLLRWAPGL